MLLLACILTLICLSVILLYKVTHANVCVEKDSYTYQAKTFTEEQNNPVKVSELFPHKTRQKFI